MKFMTRMKTERKIIESQDFSIIQQIEAETMNIYGMLCNDQGNLQRAEHFFCKSLKIREGLFGMNHSEVAKSLNNLGSLYEKMGEIKKAEIFIGNH